MGTLAAALVVGPFAPTPGEAPVRAAAASSAPVPERPNIVLITTDDQRAVEMQWMPMTRQFFAQNGIDYTQALSPNPVCCPARAEILTGQHSQNNGVLSNHNYRGGYDALRDKDNNVGSWLQAAGYQTAFLGKYLNGWEVAQRRDAGWSWWDPTKAGVYSYYGYTQNRNGDPQHYPPSGMHINEYLGMQTAALVHQWQDQPFFIWASSVAPHDATRPTAWSPAVPARQDATRYSGVRPDVFSKPTYNQQDVSSFPRELRGTKKSNAWIAARFRGRIRSLASVDRMVMQVVQSLKDTGQLEETVFMFTSDNGYLLGEHRYYGKNVAFRESLRVPMYVASPDTLGAGRTSPFPATLVDLTPTIVDYAGAVPGRTQDGLSLRSAPATNRRTTLIQAGNAGAKSATARMWQWRGVTDGRYTYTWRPGTGELELYDRERMALETRNLAYRPEYLGVRRELHRRFTLLANCTGLACNQEFPPPPPPG